MVPPSTPMAAERSRLGPVVALLGFIPLLQGCGGCSENNIISRDPVPVEDEPDDGFTNDWGSWLSMAVDIDGNPVVSYYDKTKGGLGFATATFDETGATTWSHEKVDGYADSSGLDVGDRGKYSSMAVAIDGSIWIAYQDVQNQTLRWARKGSDGLWVNGMADTGGGSSPAAGHWASLALDNAGNPVIVHHDAGKGTLRVAHTSDGATFAGIVVDEGEPATAEDGSEIEADVGAYASITVTSGIEYIAYYDAANGDLKLAWGGPATYTIEVIDAEGDVGHGQTSWSTMAVCTSATTTSAPRTSSTPWGSLGHGRFRLSTRATTWAPTPTCASSTAPLQLPTSTAATTT